MGSDGINRIVTSQGSTVRTWLVSSPTPSLSLGGTATITSGQDEGFFTSVSSDGLNAGTGIVWAVSRPSNTTSVNLYAFSAEGTLIQLFSSPAGTWPNTGGNANIVPVVANGKVYVASYQALTIFGPPAPLTAAAAQPAPLTAAAAQQALRPTPVASLPSPHVITGTLQQVDGSVLTLKTRTGQSVKIDASQAIKNSQTPPSLTLGVPYTVQGSSFEPSGAALATTITRAKGSGPLWPPDH